MNNYFLGINTHDVANDKKKMWLLGNPPINGGSKWYDLCQLNNATFTNSPSWTATPYGDIHGLTMSPGSSHVITTPLLASVSNSWVLSGLFKASAFGTGSFGYNCLFSWIGGSNYCILAVDSSRNLTVFANDTGEPGFSIIATFPNDGKWHFINFCRTGHSGSYYLYIDGINSGSSSSGTGFATGSTLYIGSRIDTGQAWDGLLANAQYSSNYSDYAIKREYDDLLKGYPNLLNRLKLFPESASLATVNKTNQYIWNVNAAISSTKQYIWNVNSTISSTKQYIWNVLSSTNKTNQYIWNLNQNVNQTNQYVWNVNQSINNLSQYIWNTRQSVNNTNQYIWNNFSIVNSVNQYIWNVNLSVNSIKELIWDVKSTVNSTSEYIWDTYSVVNSSNQYVWDCKQLINNSNQYLWNVNQNVNQISEYIWNIFGVVNKENDYIWNTRAVTNKENQYVWNILSTTNNQLQYSWNILINVNQQKDLVWNIRSTVSSSRNYVWNVYSIVNNTRQFLWNVISDSIPTIKTFNLTLYINKTKTLQTSITSGSSHQLSILSVKE